MHVKERFYMANEMETATELIETQLVEEAPQVKTKKELKKERKEIKKHKKEVKKEAKLHSAKATKFYKFMMVVTSLVVIASMLFCSFTAIKFTKSLNDVPSAESADTPANGDTGNAGGDTGNAGGNTGDTGNQSTTDTKAPAESSSSSGESSDAQQGGAADAGDPADVTTKAGAVELYKKAHAKVLAEAKSVTRTLDNNTNYKEYLEVGGNSALAGVAKTLMGTFLKANEEQLVYSGADIATNFPPTKNSCEGLTADMIGEFSVKEEGDCYIVKLAINSTEAAPDLGDNSQHLINIVSSKAVEDAAAGFVGFTGLKNEYIAPSIEAKIEKASGKMLELHTICPSYMKFDRATVMSIINVDNVGIGLQYETKWTVQW